jgi:transcriptional regulator with XRE-family HTH domain
MPDPLPSQFGHLVRRRRLAAGLSQEELAARTGVSRNYVGMVERGEANPTLLVLRDLAIALGTSMSVLIRELEKAAVRNPGPRRGSRGA